MEVLSHLEFSGSWRTAVWSLRVGYFGLVIAVAGLIVMSLTDCCTSL
jgi:hypothetical protein